MKALHFILGLILCLLAASAGVALVASAGQRNFAAEGVGHFQGAAPGWWIFAGTVLLLLLLGYLLSGIRWSRKRPLVMFDNADGRIGVDTEAVQKYLDGIKGEFAAVVSLRTALEVDAGALSVAMKIGVKEGTQIPELCRLLQARVKELLAEHLGSCDLRGVAVEVDEIRPGR